MKHINSLFFLATLAVLSFTACNKDNNNLGDAQSLDGLFQQLASPAQPFSVAAGQTQTITGAQGTRITFRPNSFRNPNGQVLQAGTVQIKLLEVYTPAQMIANRANTITNDDRLLTSGGMVHLTATYNGQKLSAGQYSIDFRQPAENASPMALFYAPDPPRGGTVIWDADTSNTVNRITKDSAGNSSYYYMFDSCTRFGWINCDYFYEAPAPKSDLFITMPDGSFDAQNTQPFVIFPGINMVSSMYQFDTATHTFSFGSSSYFLPLGTTIKIVILSNKDGQNYMQVLPQLSLTQNMVVTAAPVPVTMAEIQAVLNAL